MQNGAPLNGAAEEPMRNRLAGSKEWLEATLQTRLHDRFEPLLRITSDPRIGSLLTIWRIGLLANPDECSISG
jgi:hypothetical protein